MLSGVNFIRERVRVKKWKRERETTTLSSWKIFVAPNDANNGRSSARESGFDFFRDKGERESSFFVMIR